MKRSQRMQSVSRIASRVEREAAQVLARSRNRLRELEDKLQTMKSYRREYGGTHQDDPKNPVSIMQLRQNQAFLRQLDEAIALLEKQVSNHAQISSHDQGRWIETWKHLNSLNKAITNLKAGEQQEQERREQGRLDEHARLAKRD